MSQRAAIFAIFGAGLGAAALAIGCGPNWDLLDPSLGGSSTGHGGAGGTSSTAGTGGGGGCPSLNDGNPCTLDACVNGVAVHTPEAAGLSCSEGSGHRCDGNGACVECLAPTDCPGTDTACAARSCDTGACGTHLVASGTPTATQQPGDCKTQVCDGMGSTTFIADDSDLPVDNNQCTQDLCTAGMPSNPPVTAGATCSDGGGKLCDGAGDCVHCLVGSDCGTTTACAVYTCNAGSCPASPNLPAGTSCGSGAVCDGTGSCVTCQPVTTVTLASADVPQAAPANNGTATSSLLVTGTVGNITDVNVTVSVTGAPSGDLSLTLVSPGGTMVDLSSGNGAGAGGNFTGITFDDSAAPPAVRILYATFTSGVAIPSAIPEHDLAKLIGEDPTGTWQLAISNAGPSTSATLSAWSLQLATQASNPALPPVTLANTTAQAIPHGMAVTSTIAAAGLGPAIYEATVTVQAPHPKSGQLVISLGSPSGETILLTKNIGGSSSNVFSNTKFDDGAALLLGCAGAGCAPTNAPIPTVVPMGSLSALVGGDPNGTWTLTVTDTGNGPMGTLQGWSLALTPALCPMTP